MNADKSGEHLSKSGERKHVTHLKIRLSEFENLLIEILKIKFNCLCQFFWFSLTFIDLDQ